MKAAVVNYSEYKKEILGIRNIVFIQEQRVPENLEIDGLDSKARHALVFVDETNKAVGTGRMLPDGHIGRIAVLRQYREMGIGQMIMEKLINAARDLKLSEIWLSSQYHAKGFYQKFGFFETGGIFKDAGIDHIKMSRKL